MLSRRYAKRNGVAFLALLSASACGTYVPQIEEVYERGSLPKLERKIKEQIFCELQTSVQIINNDPLLRINVGGVDKTPLPQSWGVAITITLIVIENSSFNPSLSVISPKPSQIFTIGLGGTLSAEATRTDTFTFYYLIKDLQAESEECALKDEAHPYGRTAADLQGSSLLLTSNLGIFDWIKTAIGVRAGRGVGVKSKDEVLSYDVKFNIVTSGNLTPSWSLERVTTGTDNLFSAKRERTHELSLTFGPANDYPSVKGLSSTVSGPSQLVTNQILASQIRSALSTSVRRGFFDF